MKYDPLGTADWPIKDTTPVDAVTVDVKHGDRFVTVEIMDDPELEGNRETDVATISLYEYGKWMVTLTWQEADALAKALTEVTGVARHG